MKMKATVKKGIKSVLAFTMAMIMALLPVGDILPEVFAADTTGGSITISYDGIMKKANPNNINVAAADIKLYLGSSEVTLNVDESVHNNKTWNSLAAGSYTVVIAYSDYMKYEMSISLSDGGMATKGASDFTDACLKCTNDTTIKIQKTDITVKTVNDNATTGEYKIDKGTSGNTGVKIMFELPVSKKAESRGFALPSTGVNSGKRTYTYTTSVKNILDNIKSENGNLVYGMDDVTEQSAETGKITVESGASIEIPTDWAVSDTTETMYYRPVGNETFTINVIPETGYKFKGVTVEGAGTVVASIENNKITVGKDAGNFIVNVVQTTLPTPEGTFTITPKYEGGYSIDRELTVTFVPDHMEAGYTLQMGWNKSGPNNGLASGASWETPTQNSNGSYTYMMPIPRYGDGYDMIRYVVCRYTTSDGRESNPYLYERVEYDVIAPQVEKVSLNNGSTDTAFSHNTATENWTLQTDEWVNGDQANNTSFVLSGVKDDSGIKCVKYIFADDANVNPKTGTEINISNGTVAIPYGLSNKKTYLRYAIYDNCGNIKIGTIDLSMVKFDLTAPTLDVEVRDKAGMELSSDQLLKWQAEDRTIHIETKDPSSSGSNGEEVSTVDKITIEDNGQIREVTPGADGSYEFDAEPGIHVLKITTIDKAGNKSAEKTVTVMLDKAGIQNPNVTLNSINGTTDSTQFAKIFDITAQAESVSGIKEAVVSIYDAEGHAVKEQTITGTDIKVNGDVYQIRYPYTPDVDEFNGSVQVKFIDNVAADASGSDPHVKATVRHAFSYNKNGAKISILGNTSWTSEDVRLNISASSKSTTITEIRYYVNGALVQTKAVNGLQYTDTDFVIRDNSSMAGTEVRIEAVCGTNPESQTVNSEAIVVRVDKQAPVLRLAGVTEGSVYNTNRALQITTVENVYNAMKPVQVTATKTIDGVTSDIDLGAYQVQSGSDVTNKIFTEDGVYHVTVLAEDAAGNKDVKTVSFTIDKTAPVLNITGTTEGAYSNRPVTLNFQSIESFFETNNVRIMVERRLDGTTYGRNVIFANTAKNSSVSNTFSEDGDYTITMSAIDAAGNEAAVKTLTFTVDCTAPAVSLTGTKDYFVTQSAVALDFSVIESYYQTNQVQIQASRRLANGKVETVAIPAWSNSGKNSSLRQQFTEDGYYTVNITATDKAGNRKEQTIHFTIDTEKPVIADLSKYDGKYLKSFRLEEDMDTLITELTVPTVKMTLNGEAYDGSEVTADGKYTFVIEVTDEVGLTASKTIEFVIDNTLPKIIFAGAEDGKWYTEVVRLNVSLENENDTITEILINGEPYTLTEGKTAYDLTFDTFGDYEVTINSVDAAGNTNSQTISFTYAEHKKVAWLWIGGGAVVLLAGVGVGVMVFMKKGNTNADA